MKVWMKRILLCVLAMVFVLSACSAKSADDYSRYFGQKREKVLESLEKAGIKASESKALAGAWTVEGTEEKFGHAFSTELCFDLENEQLYGYQLLWSGIPTDETYDMIGSLYEELKETYGEPTQKDNPSGRIEPNLEDLQVLREKTTEHLSLLEVWQNEDAQYSQIYYRILFLPTGEITVMIDFRD